MRKASTPIVESPSVPACADTLVEASKKTELRHGWFLY